MREKEEWLTTRVTERESNPTTWMRENKRGQQLEREREMIGE